LSTKKSRTGVIVQYGGQTPLKLALGLEAAGVPIIGTSPDMIDATDRERFQKLLHELGLRHLTPPPALSQRLWKPPPWVTPWWFAQRTLVVSHEIVHQHYLERYRR
jgi:carbamoylphosphate synthase large subunit